MIGWLNDMATVLTVAAGAAVALEIAADRWQGRARDLPQTRLNLQIGIAGQLLSHTLIGAVVGAVLSKLPLLTAPIATTPLTALACFVGVDFLYYWSHRLEHRVRLLWGHHSVHHSSHAYDLSTSLRVAWHDGLFAALYNAPLAMLGFSPMLVLVCYQLVLLAQVWVHTTRIARLPFIEGILNTPSAHRVHHGKNAYAIDKNYGGVFLLWDRLFGTYAAERVDEPLAYGLTEPVTSTHPVVVNFAAYPRIARDVANAPLGEKIWAAFGPPEWSIREGFTQTSPSSLWSHLAKALKLRGASKGW